MNERKVVGGIFFVFHKACVNHNILLTKLEFYGVTGTILKLIKSHLSVYQKGAHYTGIKAFNRLPVPIKQLSHDTNQFKMPLKGFCIHSFYSDEYLKYNANYIFGRTRPWGLLSLKQK
jgi:hypothetical protein